MQKNVWTPIFVGLSLLAPALLISLLLPETLRPGTRKATGPVSSSEDNRNHTSTLNGAPRGSSSSQRPKTAWIALKHAIRGLVTAAAFFIKLNRHVTLLLTTLLVTTLGKHAQDVLLQFARKRYDWTWAQVR